MLRGPLATSVLPDAALNTTCMAQFMYTFNGFIDGCDQKIKTGVRNNTVGSADMVKQYDFLDLLNLSPSYAVGRAQARMTKRAPLIDVLHRAKDLDIEEGAENQGR